MTSHNKGAPPLYLVRQIAAEEAQRVGVTADDVLGVRRLRRFTFARAWVCKRLRDAGYTLPGIGLRLGMDHSSVHHALARDLPRDFPEAVVEQGPRKIVLIAHPSECRRRVGAG